MPLAHVVCPHCEKPVELNVTSVTRSRPCPNCEAPVMLQFMQRSGKVKRKALLVTATPGGLDFDSMRDEIPAYEPQPLPGDALERMKADPELHLFRQRFLYGIGAVAAIIVIVSIAHFTIGLRKTEKTNLLDATRRDEGEEYVSSSSLKTTRMEAASRPDKRPDKLEFQGIEEPVQAEDAPAAPPAGASAKRMQAVGSALTKGAALPPASAAKPSAPPPLISPGMASSLPRDMFRVPRQKKNDAGMRAHDLSLAKTVVIGFLRAESVEARLKFMLDRGMTEERARAWYQAKGDGPVAYQRIESSEIVSDGSMSEHDIRLVGGAMRRVSVVRSGDSYLVDWPSFVLLSEMEWGDFMAAQPTRPMLFRVVAEPAEVFTGGFADGRGLLCVKLINPSDASLPPIYAYVQRGTATGRELEYWLGQSSGSVLPLTVRLKYPSAAETDNQVWLSELVSTSWVVRDGRALVDVSSTVK
jgi:hypothetical protein